MNTEKTYGELCIDNMLLQQENQQLKEELQKCTRKHWQQKSAEHYINEKIYKERIDKAIEFINIYTDGINLHAFDCLNLMYKIEEILKGE